MWIGKYSAGAEGVERGELMYINAVKSLTQLPATDLNFTADLQRATDTQIKMALEIMRNRDGKDKSRIKACEVELKRRGKIVKEQSQ